MHRTACTQESPHARESLHAGKPTCRKACMHRKARMQESLNAQESPHARKPARTGKPTCRKACMQRKETATQRHDTRRAHPAPCRADVAMPVPQ
eukprot:265542-Chlamydomonas_euryale.AAC.1